MAKTDNLYLELAHENANKTRTRLKEFFTIDQAQIYIEKDLDTVFSKTKEISTNS